MIEFSTPIRIKSPEQSNITDLLLRHANSAANPALFSKPRPDGSWQDITASQFAADAAAIAKGWGIETVGELLDVVPRRYLTPGELTDLAGLRAGDDVVVWARVKSARGFRARTGREVFTATITDGSLSATRPTRCSTATAHRPWRSASSVAICASIGSAISAYAS